MTTRSTPRTLRIIALALVMAALMGVYLQTLHHDFINYDDQLYVTENHIVQAGLTAEGTIWAFTTFRASNWHPVTWLSHMLDYELYGMNPAGHHATNLILHALNTLLLLALLWSATRRYWPSLLVAALFGLHPLHVESVAWVAERKDLLSALFMLLTLLCYSRYARAPGVRLYLAALLFFAIGLMAKPMLVTLPFALLLWDIWPLGRHAAIPLPADEGGGGHPCTQASLRQLLLEKVPFLLLALASCIITYLAQHQGGTVASIKALSLPFRVANALQSYLLYLMNMFWPRDLAVIYPLPTTIPLTTGVLAGLALLSASAAALWLGRRHPWLPVGWFWYLGTLVPVIGIVQVGQQALADRYTYIPLLGIFINIAWGAATLVQRLRVPTSVPATLGVMALAALSLVSWKQVGYWRDSITLFSHTSTVVANNNIAYRLLGIALSKKWRYGAAEKAFQAALRIRPDDADTQTELGVLLLEMGQPVEAAQQFNKVLRVTPSHLFARMWLAHLLKEQGMTAEAIKHYQLALKENPGRYYVHNSLGTAYLDAGDAQSAQQQFRLALGLDPTNAEILYNVGLAAGMEGNLAESIDYLSRAVAIRPGFAEAHYNLGTALARAGDFNRAIGHFSAALRINPSFSEARRALEIARGRQTGVRLPAP